MTTANQQYAPLRSRAPVAAVDYAAAAKAALTALFRAAGYRSAIVRCDCNGSTAAIDWTESQGLIKATLTLPTPPASGIYSRKVADAYTGYWVHEALHPMYSDLDAYREAITQHGQKHPGESGYFAALANCIEDCRIEHLAKRNNVVANLLPVLSRLRSHTFADKIDPADLQQPDAIPYIIKLWGNLDNGVAITGAPEALAQVPPAFDPVIQYARQRMFTPRYVETPQGALDLTTELMDQLRKPQPPQPPQPPEPPGPGDDDGQPGDDDGQQGDDGQPGDDDGQPGDDDGQQGDDGQPGDDDGQPGDDDGQQGDDGQPGDDKEQDGPVSNGPPAPIDLTTNPYDGSDTPAAEDNPDRDYLHVDFDLPERFKGADQRLPPIDSRNETYHPWELIEAGVKQFAKARNVLRKAIKSPAKEEHRRRRRAGRLDPRDLSRARQGEPDVFRSRMITPAKNTALSIIVDMSGSMLGENYSATVAMAYTISQLARQAGVPFEIYGYHHSPALRIKSYRERWTAAQERAAFQKLNLQDLGGSTMLTPAIYLAADRMATVREQVNRRVMFVLTDGGCDYGPVNVRVANDYAHARGIETYCLGLGLPDPLQRAVAMGGYSGHVFSEPDTLTRDALATLDRALNK